MDGGNHDNQQNHGAPHKTDAKPLSSILALWSAAFTKGPWHRKTAIGWP